jgi:hypothetical protein
MASNAQEYNLAAIRQLLLAAFTPEEFRRFCYDSPTFRPVINRFGLPYRLDDMVDELITYCDNYLLFPELLAELKQYNPRQYTRFEPELRSPADAVHDTIANIRPPSLAPGTAPPPPTLIVGRGAAMVEMRARLAGPAATTVITVVRGWPGVGKTTLAAALAHDDELNSAFPDGVLWAALGPDADPLPGLGSWLTALGVDPRDMPTMEERSGRLAALLRNRRMLLIIDDVWDAAQGQPFCAGGLGCRTLITTRYPEVARDLGLSEQSIYRLEVLDDKAAVELLRSLAPDAVAKDPEGTLRLARELEGLPLALRVAGGLLAAEVAMGWGIGDLLRELAEGTRILKERAPADLADLASQTRPTVAVLLAKSTDRLDDVTRDRFALLGAFVPKPATFDGAAVAAVWQVDDPRPTLRLLVDRGLLEPAGGGRFQMHALLAVHAQALCDA